MIVFLRDNYFLEIRISKGKNSCGKWYNFNPLGYCICSI